MGTSSSAVQYASQCGPMSWEAVPDFLRESLKAQNCTLLGHRRQWPPLQHIRFQFAPLAYQGELYFLQRWSRHEWGVSPSQIMFPMEGPCPLKLLSNSSLLLSVVETAIAIAYGRLSINSLIQPPSCSKQHINDDTSPLVR